MGDRAQGRPGRLICRAGAAARPAAAGRRARGGGVQRYAVIAVLLTPSWIAGIHRVRSSVYQPTNAAAAAVWACGIGVGSYLAGPAVIDVVDDFGTGTSVILAVVVVGALALELARRYRLRSRPQR